MNCTGRSIVIEFGWLPWYLGTVFTCRYDRPSTPFLEQSQVDRNGKKMACSLLILMVCGNGSLMERWLGSLMERWLGSLMEWWNGSLMEWWLDGLGWLMSGKMIDWGFWLVAIFHSLLTIFTDRLGKMLWQTADCWNAVCWHGLLEWIVGMDCWNGLLEWIVGMDCWNEDNFLIVRM